MSREINPLLLKYDDFSCEPIIDYLYLEQVINHEPQIIGFQCHISKRVRFGDTYMQVNAFSRGKDYAEAVANAEKQFNEKVEYLEKQALAKKQRCECCGKIL